MVVSRIAVFADLPYTPTIIIRPQDQDEPPLDLPLKDL